MKGTNLYQIYMLFNRKGVRLFVLIFLFFLCVLIGWHLDQLDPGSNSHTHLFYIPVIICGIWYGKRVFFATIPMTIVHLAIEYLRNGELSYNPFLRVSVLNLIALVIIILTNQIRILNQNLKEQIVYIKQMNDSVSDVMGRCDLEGFVRYITPAVTRSYGYLPEDILDASFLSFVYPADRAMMIEAMTEAQNSTFDFRKECRILTKYNGPVWAEVLVSPIMVESNCIGSVFLCTDITERKIAEESFIEAIYKDEMTGLYNRRFIDKTLDQMISKAKNMKSKFSVLMLDIDFFKKVNDTYGHPVGDQVLVKVGELFRECVRASDWVGRFGGEEFMILLPETNIFGAISLAEKIRMTFSKYHFPVAEHITISIGAVEYQNMENRLSVYERADQALYTAKRRGRNRVFIYSKFQFDHMDFKDFDYKCGHPQLDQQHEELLNWFQSIINSFMEEKPRGEINKAFSSLRKELLAHFSYEEYVLKEKGYKNLSEHRKTHASLLAEMEQLIRITNHYYELDHVLILLFLFEIVVKHIETDDKKYFDYL